MAKRVLRSMTPHDRHKVIALLKSVATPCDSSDAHTWRRCRHCLAIAELEQPDIRYLLAAFIQDVEQSH